MDWHEESDYSSDNFPWDERNFLTRTKSDVSLSGLTCNVCSQGVQANFGCKESRSFTSAFERLELESEIESKDDTTCLMKTSDAQTDPFEGYDYEPISGFKTREMSTFRLVIQGPEILNFQGTRHSPEDIARYWKKDSRMWLWKSVRLARRKKRLKSLQDQ